MIPLEEVGALRLVSGEPTRQDLLHISHAFGDVQLSGASHRFLQGELDPCLLPNITSGLSDHLRDMSRRPRPLSYEAVEHIGSQGLHGEPAQPAKQCFAEGARGVAGDEYQHTIQARHDVFPRLHRDTTRLEEVQEQRLSALTGLIQLVEQEDNLLVLHTQAGNPSEHTLLPDIGRVACNCSDDIHADKQLLIVGPSMCLVHDERSAEAVGNRLSKG